MQYKPFEAMVVGEPLARERRGLSFEVVGIWEAAPLE